MKYGLAYIPEYMGCLREHPEAKSSAGGTQRTREIRDMLRRHTGKRISPGYVVYGLDTAHRVWCRRVERMFPRPLTPISGILQYGIRVAAGLIMERTVANSQGLHSDGWAGPRLRYMLPPGNGPVVIEGTLPPEREDLYGQRLYISAHGRELCASDVQFGDFRFVVSPPPERPDRPLYLEIRALRSVTSGRFTLGRHRSRLAYQLKSIRWGELAREPESLSLASVSRR